MRDYRKYDIWKLGHEITLNIYKLSAAFPEEERYGITGQVRRAAYSIPSNIAEGCGRSSDAEFKRYLTISLGSASELEYFTMLIRDLGYIKESDFDTLYDDVNKVRRSLNNLINKV
ncbi:four helix bundle protein [Spongiimicrobium sp. 2-473A-2-J]|uniref:four helix bundle protein n=1 Tax=Eudoraea algarum TaxID=3417568 RepID=UPI003D36288B